MGWVDDGDDLTFQQMNIKKLNLVLTDTALSLFGNFKGKFWSDLI